MYSRRMDSQYVDTVWVADVVVQFSSFRAGWTSSWCSRWRAVDAAGGSTSADVTIEARATAARTAAGVSKRRSDDVQMLGTSEATRGGKTMRPISEHRRRASARKLRW
jgi:hypothetical protein